MSAHDAAKFDPRAPISVLDLLSDCDGSWTGEGNWQMRPDGSPRELQLVTHRLIDEFSGRIDVDTIVSVAREEVLLFDRAKVRDFVAIIAWRLAPERLTEHLGHRVAR